MEQRWGLLRRVVRSMGEGGVVVTHIRFSFVSLRPSLMHKVDPTRPPWDPRWWVPPLQPPELPPSLPPG